MKPIINTTQRTQKFLELPDYGVPVYIQFGKAKKNKKRPRVVINPLSGLKNTRDKLRQHEILQEAGIPKPRFMRTYREAVAYMEETGNTIIAKRVNHYRGKGMYMLREPQHIFEANPVILDPSQYYFEEFVNCNREWRIHMARHREIISYRKCLLGEVVEEVKATDSEKPWIRNLENCYFKLDSNEDKAPWWNRIIDACKLGMEALNLDVGAVDVGENNKVEGGAFYIYEYNSAPGMEENTRTHYETAIDELIKQKHATKN